MNRVELIEHLATRHQLSKAESGRILQTLLDAVVTAVKKGPGVTLPGFGSAPTAPVVVAAPPVIVNNANVSHCIIVITFLCAPNLLVNNARFFCPLACLGRIARQHA